MTEPVLSAEAETVGEESQARTFCLFVERDGQAGQPCETIDIPGLTTLSIVDHLVSVAPGRREGTLVLEPQFDGPQPVLIVAIGRPQERLDVNGAPIGPTHALCIKDVVTIDTSDLRLHVSVRYRPYIGPARPHQIGQSCPVCLTPVEGPREDGRETQVLVCTACGVVLHEVGWLGEGDQVEMLECSRTVLNCPVCNAPLVREETTAYVPEID